MKKRYDIQTIQNHTNEKIKKAKIAHANKIRKIKQEEARKIDALNKRTRRRTIPIFYATDESYLPYLSVSINSLKAHASDFCYEIHVLHDGISDKAQAPLTVNEENFKVQFINVKDKLEEISNDICMRDYYSGATYYRIFIANMFPQFDKAIYLDGDTVINADIAKLYSYDLKDCLIGAVTDEVVQATPVFSRYVREALGIDERDYFNAGVLVMNLDKLRKSCFYDKFKELLYEYKFIVAQDQDYLNVLCKGKVKYLPYSWNTMPISKRGQKSPSIVHYNLTMKPWHYGDVPYSELFWKYASKSYYCDEIRKSFGSYLKEREERDKQTEINLLALAQRETEREDNFIKSRNKTKKDNLRSARFCKDII